MKIEKKREIISVEEENAHVKIFHKDTLNYVKNRRQ